VQHFRRVEHIAIVMEATFGLLIFSALIHKYLALAVQSPLREEIISS